MSILQKIEEMGMQKGIQEGIQEGRKERNIEIAKNLLKEEVEVALVVKATSLSKSEVEKLQEQLNN